MRVPILWRYLIGHFLKIMISCVLAFVAILFTMRLDEIAHFAGLGAPLSTLLLFTLYQIPYILPIALPLSCLIASLLLMQRLSNTHELTALRASGCSLIDILAPIWLMAAFLALGNFWVASEMATQSHFQTNLLKSELRSLNPLLLLHNKHLMRLKGFYFEALGPSQVGESSSQVILAFPDQRHQRLHLMSAQHLFYAKPQRRVLGRIEDNSALFIAERVSLISTIPSKQEEEFDQLFVENIKKSLTPIEDFSILLQKDRWIVNNDYLQMHLLLARMQEEQQLIQEARLKGQNEEELKTLQTHLNRTVSEIIKRISMALAVLSFTLMGTAFGIHMGRRGRFYFLYLPIGLTTLYLVAFFVAKGIDHDPWIAGALFLIPHCLMVSASTIMLRRVARGTE